MEEDDRTMEELMAKKQHPQRLHPEMWFNDPGEVKYYFPETNYYYKDKVKILYKFYLKKKYH